MKIVYCTDTIYHLGGIQMVTIAKANALAEIQGNHVWIVVTELGKDPITTIDEKVHVCNLGIKYYENDWKGLLYQIKSFFFKRKLHKQRLRELLNKILPDIVISTGTSEKYILPSLDIKSKPSYIREIHFAKNYRFHNAKGIISRLIAYWSNYLDYGWKIKKYDRIIILTNKDKKNWNDSYKVEVIPNPVILRHSYLSECKNHVVIAAGRLVPQKNFESLVRSWRKVVDKHSDWILQIWGSGADEHKIKELIIAEKLEKHVYLMGFTNDLFSHLSEASIFALTSKYEGFAMVLIEAMSVGIPVVSFDCPYGPSDIITDEHDGYLVTLDDEESMCNKLCTLIENEKLRKTMGQNAMTKSKAYSIDLIIEKWMTLFYEVRNRTN